jgi:hypothetical protein
MSLDVFGIALRIGINQWGDALAVPQVYILIGVVTISLFPCTPSMC